MTANCKSGWIEMMTPTGEPEIRIRKRISPGDIREIKQEHQLTQKTLSDRKAFLIKNTRAHRAFRANTSRYRSLLCVPIFSNNHAYGAVYVVSELVNVFEEVTVRSLSTYAEQAGIALENAHLIKNSIELERYQEQLKIAKEVQNQLLPRHLPVDDKIEIVALSENAQEVGGDYYDVVTLRPGLYQVAIGDVSGKGTTAAFHMAELKGVFHALSHLELGVQAWVGYANRALSACMQKGFFVTLTYLIIDTETRRAELVRAGHCPAFWYRAGEDMLEQLREGAPGLGIVRNASYDKLVPPPEVLTFAPGDCLILYTDGILEARNEAKEEFGYARMHEIIHRHRKDPPREIAAAIVHSAKAFARSALQDDYTVLVIRFG
jgi:serine phosphatase RsbU (regulator of sigma subunit)